MGQAARYGFRPLGFTDMAAFGQLFGQKTRVSALADEPARHPQVSSKFQAAA